MLLPKDEVDISKNESRNPSSTLLNFISRTNGKFLVKGTGHFFETLSVASVPGTDHSWIYAFLINNSFQAEKCIYMPVPVFLCCRNFFSDFKCLSRNRYTSLYASVDMSTPAQYIFHVYLVVNPKRELNSKFPLQLVCRT